jgi:nucleotide-binding universal stress UspA family protein
VNGLSGKAESIVRWNHSGRPPAPAGRRTLERAVEPVAVFVHAEGQSIVDRGGGSLNTRILLASNGAKPARDAGLLLRRLADAQRVHVTVNVCDSVEFAFPEEPWTFGGERKPRPQPAEVGKSEVAAFEAAGFDTDLTLGSGIPAAEILEQVKAGGYQVTVMGAGSARWLDNFLLGSTSTRVLHTSASSVLIVHHAGDSPEKVKVLVATDGSADAGHALDVFAAVADSGKVAVTVVSVADQVPRLGRLIPKTVPAEEVGGFLMESAKKSAEIAAGHLERHGFEVATVTPTGEPVREILQLAKDFDLVVCGSRGMGGASRMLLGSVSDQLARLAPATLVGRKA